MSISAFSLATGSFLVYGGVNVFLNLVLYCFHRFKLFSQYRIQGSKYPDAALLRECYIDAAVGFLLIFPAHYLVFPFFKGCGLHSGSLPAWWELALFMAGCIVVNDTCFYWSHRLLHHPRLYGLIHKKHHRFKVQVGLAAMFSHPLESAINFLCTITIPAWVMGYCFGSMHVNTYYLWLLLSSLETTDAHSGYNFPFSPFNWIEVAPHHDYHHSHNKGCYGGFFLLWDRLCGTDSGYNQFVAKQKQTS